MGFSMSIIHFLRHGLCWRVKNTKRNRTEDEPVKNCKKGFSYNGFMKMDVKEIHDSTQTETDTKGTK